MAGQMAEYALYVALRHLRRMGRYEQDQRRAQWNPQPFRPRASVSIGVLGLGVMGGSIARTLADFGFSVRGWSRSAKDLAGIGCFHGERGLERVLTSSEVLFAALPLTAETFELLDEHRLSRLSPGSTLANLSRGQVLSEVALVAALDAGVIAEAFLDVFATEPLPREHPFWARSDIRITPHVAALTPPEAAADQVASKIRALIAGEQITGIVNRELGY